jgi:hypothetical protein
MNPHSETDIREDTTGLLDFEPECHVDILIVRGGCSTGIYLDKCTKTAVWVGTAPCGHDGFFCEEHHYDQRPFVCHLCGHANMMLATYIWIRL